MALLLLMLWISQGSLGPSPYRENSVLGGDDHAGSDSGDGCPKMKLYNVWPVTDTDPREVAMGTLRMIAVLAFAVPPTFLLGRVKWRSSKKGIVWWFVILAVTMLLIAVEIFGVFGPELTARLRCPSLLWPRRSPSRGQSKGWRSLWLPCG